MEGKIKKIINGKKEQKVISGLIGAHIFSEMTLKFKN